MKLQLKPEASKGARHSALGRELWALRKEAVWEAATQEVTWLQRTRIVIGGLRGPPAGPVDHVKSLAFTPSEIKSRLEVFEQLMHGIERRQGQGGSRDQPSQ